MAQPHIFKNLLLLSGGSKVATSRIAKAAVRKRGATLHISDTTPNVPTSHVADQFTVLPPSENENWAESLAHLCEKNKIGLIIPTRHSELLHLAQAADLLRQAGTEVSLSGESTLKLCIDKLDTYQFLLKNGFPCPATYPSPARLNWKELNPPFIAKPANGFSSQGFLQIEKEEDLKQVPSDWLIQTKVTGVEFTTNLYIDKKGEVACAIPHQRLSVESGEVVYARTRRIPKLIDLCVEVANKLPDAKGIINIQAFLDEATDKIEIIEINPRIGGGYPLCDAAQGHYIEWLCQEHLHQKSIPSFDNWTDKLTMQRYREAIFSL
ncbi:ATP-grasp domain-containing protein [Pelagicoccus albus]|uniref:ATP-grasp domain-containing protein n=1 Tax=Pelagicoccus albus TaxID=415222 RepID=A0A7X1B528_9BACT|nr:ATP-grasp domain-containing protein [Pelagicoccus albus]MBC2605770.1 ATP-grasp domain-containing protein [Pelagicoccus albus]